MHFLPVANKKERPEPDFINSDAAVHCENVGFFFFFLSFPGFHFRCQIQNKQKVLPTAFAWFIEPKK